MEFGSTILVMKDAKKQMVVTSLEFGQEGRYVLGGIYAIPVNRVIIRMKFIKSSQVTKIKILKHILQSNNLAMTDSFFLFHSYSKLSMIRRGLFRRWH